jgi:hypothetical protein
MARLSPGVNVLTAQADDGFAEVSPFVGSSCAIQRGRSDGLRSALDEPAPTAYLFAVPSPDPLPFTPLETAALLPDRFRRWFASRGWSPREHQLALLAKARDDASALLIAPTGAGKTLAGFLPTLVELSSPAAKGGGEKSLISTGRGVKRTGGLHTLYISPLKALAVDIARNLETPIAEMGCRSRSRPAPAIRRCRGGSGSGAIRRTSCSPRRSNWRCCCPPTTRRSVLLAQAHRARRAACARHLQARRSAVAGPGAAVAAGARDARDRSVRDGGRAGIAGAVSGAAARRQEVSADIVVAGGAAAPGRRDARHQGAPAMGRATPRAMRSAKCTS